MKFHLKGSDWEDFREFCYCAGISDYSEFDGMEIDKEFSRQIVEDIKASSHCIDELNESAIMNVLSQLEV